MSFLEKMNYLFYISILSLAGISLIVLIKNSTLLSNFYINFFKKIIPDDDLESIRMKSLMAKVAFFITVIFISVFIISFYLTFVIPFFLPDDFFKENKFTGPFGDLFNGLATPVVTFLTFCGLLITIIIQNTQMRLTLQELRNNKLEMEKSTEALEAQVKNTFSQKIDNNFYSLLNYHEKISGELGSNPQKLINEILLFGHQTKKWENFENPELSRKFFLINYQILKFLKKHEDSGDISFYEAKTYANIVRATLTEEIYGLIFINCSFERFEKYKILLEHYQFLEHFCFKNFMGRHTAIAIKQYKSNIFGNGINLNIYLRSESSKLVFNSVYQDISQTKESLGEYIDEVLKLLDFETRFEVFRKNDELMKAIISKESLLDSIDLFNIINDPEFINHLTIGDSRNILKYLSIETNDLYLCFNEIEVLIETSIKDKNFNFKYKNQKLNDFKFWFNKIKYM